MFHDSENKCIALVFKTSRYLTVEKSCTLWGLLNHVKKYDCWRVLSFMKASKLCKELWLLKSLWRLLNHVKKYDCLKVLYFMKTSKPYKEIWLLKTSKPCKEIWPEEFRLLWRLLDHVKKYDCWRVYKGF